MTKLKRLRPKMRMRTEIQSLRVFADLEVNLNFLELHSEEFKKWTWLLQLWKPLSFEIAIVKSNLTDFYPPGVGLDLGWSPAHCNIHWGPKFYSVHSIEIVVFTQREHAPCRHAIMTWHGLLHKGFHINRLCWLQYTKTLTLKCRYHLT